VIKDGLPVRLYTGFGANGEATLFWGRPQGVWNDLGDCAQLFNPNGGRYVLSFGGVTC
jgi:hypothetical protein